MTVDVAPGEGQPGAAPPALTFVVVGGAAPALLASLRAQSDPDFEVVVVGGDPRGLAIGAGREGGGPVPRRVAGGPGVSRARNAGLGAARGALVGVLDAGDALDAGAVALARALFARRPDLGAALGRAVEGADEDAPPAGGPLRRADALALLGPRPPGPLVARRAALALAGGFDEALGPGAGTPFPGGEVADLLLRLVALGVPLRAEPGLVARRAAPPDAPAARLARARALGPVAGRVARAHGTGPYHAAGRAAGALAAGAGRLAAGDVAGARERAAWARGLLRGYLAPPATARRGWEPGRAP